MNREKIFSLIKENRAHLTKLGVKSLSLFGSVARGEAREPKRDIDMLVELEGKVTFDRFMDTKFFLEDLLGVSVDLVMPQTLRPQIKPYIMQDLIHVA